MTSSLTSANARGVWSRLPGALYFVFLAGLLLAMGYVLVRRPLFGRYDFWAHAAIGRWIWQSGHVPDHTLFLWTASQPWVYQSWLFQVLCYGLTEIGRPDQLPYVVSIFTALLALSPFALVGAVWRSTSRLSCWMAIPILLALQGIAVRFHARPELCTALFLCVLMVFLVAWSRRRDSVAAGRVCRWEYAGLAGLLLLFVAWVNLHGGVLLGLLLLAVTAGADLVQDRFDRRSRVLALFTVVVALALCINPYGVDYWRAYRPIGTFAFSRINEWKPIWKGAPIRPEMIVAVAVVSTLAVLAWALNDRRRLSHLAWLLMMGVLFTFARRNVWPLTLTGLMVLAANARSLDPEFLWQKMIRWVRGRLRGDPESRKPWRQASSLSSGSAYIRQAGSLSPRPSSLSGQPLSEMAQREALPSPIRLLFRTGVLAWLVLECLTLLLDAQPWEPLIPNRLEKGVARFIHEKALTGRVFNDYENSSYLQWSLAGRPALFIDLINAYPDQVVIDYLDIIHVTARGQELLDSRRTEPIEVIVLTTNRADALSLAQLADYLDASKEWARVFVGKDGVIWVRRTPAYEHLWKPVMDTISDVSFKTLEGWGEDRNFLTQGVGPEDVGSRKKP